MESPKYQRGIQPLNQVFIESLSRDEVFGYEILDWVLPSAQVNGWGLPSHGSATHDSCGSYFMRGCLNVNEHPEKLAVFKPSIKRCFSPLCPECWNSWVFREADRIDDRIKKAIKIDPLFGKPIHFMVSVPRAKWSLPIERLRSESYEVAKRVGFKGGSCIFHPLRETNNGRWYFSPHFHMIGYGWIEGVSNEFKISGWIAKNLRVRKSVFGTAYYQLTHCGVWYGGGIKHSVTWFGALSYSKLPLKKLGLSRPIDSDERGCCPYCGSKLKSLTWFSNNFNSDPPLPCAGIGGFYLAEAENENGYWVEYYFIIPFISARSMLEVSCIDSI